MRIQNGEMDQMVHMDWNVLFKLKNQNFIDAEFNTSFVDTHPELTDYDDELPPSVIAAAISAAIAAHEGI